MARPLFSHDPFFPRPLFSQAAQDAFEGKLNERIDAIAERDHPVLAAARATLGNRVQLLLGVVDELDDLDARPELDTLIARLNEAITGILGPARSRQTRGQDPEPESEPHPA